MVDDVHSILNGRLLSIRKDEWECLHFTDRITGEILVSTTKMVERTDATEHGYFTIRTESGTTYRLWLIKSVLPTKAISAAPTNDAPPVDTFNFAVKNKEYSCISDGGNDEVEYYIETTTYIFYRDITKEEFVEFCKLQGHPMVVDSDAVCFWSMNGSNNKWTYTCRSIEKNK